MFSVGLLFLHPSIIIIMAVNNEAIDLLRDFQKENIKFTNAVEFRDPVTLQVEGKIPEWLNGILYRIGRLHKISFSEMCHLIHSMIQVLASSTLATRMVANMLSIMLLMALRLCIDSRSRVLIAQCNTIHV